MSREIRRWSTRWREKKRFPRDIVFGALELALASATKKRIHDEADARRRRSRNR